MLKRRRKTQDFKRQEKNEHSSVFALLRDKQSDATDG